MLILHAFHADGKRQVVHIISPDTDVFILGLRRLPWLGPHTAIINGIGSKWKLVMLKPIYDKIGNAIADALPVFNALTGRDTTGRFCGKGKKLCWKALNKLSDHVIKALANLGKSHIPS